VRDPYYPTKVVREIVARAAALQRSAPGVIPGLVFVAVATWWSIDDGGFDPLVWIPGSILLVALTVVYVTTAPRRFVSGRSVVVAAVFLLAFTGWCFLSIVWSSAPDLAWSGSNLTAVYFAVFVIFSWRPWPAAVAAALLGAFSISTALVGLIAFISATGSDSPGGSFIAGRLATPITYSNANAALFVSAALPALYLASRREVHWILRGVFVSVVGVLAELALMSQSRATIVAVPLTLLVLLAIAPGRTRIAITLAAVAGVVALVGAGPVLHVYEAVVSGAGISSAFASARRAILASAAILFVLGAGIGLLDRRVVVPRRVAFGVGAAIVAVFLLVSATGSVLFVHKYQPSKNASGWWQQFKGGGYLYEPGTPHLVSGFGSGRYDIWRVSFNRFKRDPWLGAGVDTFGAEYLLHRTRLDDPIYPHSIELRTLGGTGLIGTALLLGFFIAWGISAVRRVRRGSEFSRGVVASCIAVVVYWLLHGSVDWLWEMPVLGAVAFACMGLACATGAESTEPAAVPNRERTRWSLRARRVLPVAAIGLTVVVIGSMSIPWLSAREIDAAASGWPASPRRAFEQLDRARTYNPLSDQPDIYAGVIAGQIGDERRQRASFEHAIERNATNWYPYLVLGALNARQGDIRLGLRQLNEAHRLDPLEPVIIDVQRLVRADKPPSNAAIDRMLVARVNLLTGRSQG